MDDIVAWTRGGRTTEAFDDNFFSWWAQHIPVIEDYPYAEIEFSRDPKIPIPPSEERGEMGKLVFFLFLFFLNLFNFLCCFYIYHFFYTPEYMENLCQLCAYVRPGRPVDFVRNRRRPRPEAAPIADGRRVAAAGPPSNEAERFLRRVE
jgi:hypothetical protein